MTKISSIIILSFVIFLNSCGYGFQGAGTVLPDDVRIIAIPVVENKTTDPTLALLLTEAVRSRFERYGIVTVVEQPLAADAVLKLSIESVQTRVLDVTSQTDIELGTELVMHVSGELNRTNGALLWKNPSLIVQDSFASAGNVVVTSSSGFAQSGITSQTLGTLGSRELARGQQQEALDSLIEEVARRIYFQSVAEDF